jgi:DNA-binding response OmpR family regulator
MTPKTPILIVDDDKTIRKLLERVALRAGFDVDCARDGVEALEMLDAKTYEIAIVDLMMPRVSGYELVEKISAMNPRPAVLVATAMASTDVASLDDSLVRRVIRKPFDIEAVAKALIETAKQLAEQREQKNDEIPIAPPEAATLPVVVNAAPEEEPAKVEEKPAATDAAPIEDPPKNVN